MFLYLISSSLPLQERNQKLTKILHVVVITNRIHNSNSLARCEYLLVKIPEGESVGRCVNAVCSLLIQVTEAIYQKKKKIRARSIYFPSLYLINSLPLSIATLLYQNEILVLDIGKIICV
jgi:hypothetical protein